MGATAQSRDLREGERGRQIPDTLGPGSKAGALGFRDDGW